MRAVRTIKAIESNIRGIRKFITASPGANFYKGADRKVLQALLRDHGFYSTEGRLELLSTVKSANRLVSVPEVVAKLPGRLDEVSVYRALEAFTRTGILSRSDLRGGGTRYEMAHGHHHHVICNNCGVTEDVEECADKNLETRVLKSSKSFAAINTHALEFFGTCNSCVNK